MTKGGVKVSEVVSRLADSSRDFLNRQVALPVEAIAEFKAMFEKVSPQSRASTKKAKKASGHSRARTEKAKQ